MIAVLAVFGPRAAHAEARHAAMVLDANTGAVLHDNAGDQLRHPASLTKMMTLYMAFELIEAGRLSYNSKIKVSQEAASAAPSKLELEPGEQIAAIDAIKALITKSANDMAIALAEHIGGSEANFVRLMNAKAKKIGMARTTFRNASGLPDPEQVTTARDMITLGLRLQDDFPRHYHLFGTRAFSYNGGTYRNHNTLLNSYRGTDGIKTGYTRASGFNLVASVRRDGRHVVAAVFGGASAAARNAHMRVLLDRGLARASTQVTRKPVLVAKATPAERPQRPRDAAKPTPAAAPVVVARNTPRLAPAAPAASARVAEPVLPVVPAPNEPAVAAPLPPDLPPAMEQAGTGNIEIAKVRRVMVAPRVRPAAPAVADNSTEEPTTAAPPADAAPVDAAPVRAAPPPRPAIAVAAPVMPPVAVAAPRPAPSLPSPTPVLGARPSTLQAQAANIESGRPPVAIAAQSPRAGSPLPPPYGVKGPMPAPAAAPTARGGFQIQVGAYSSAAEAERQLATVGQRAGSLLAAHPGLAMPVSKGDRQMFRARFAGFDAGSASKACLELRRLSVDCFVMKAE